MKNVSIFASVFIFMSLAILACGLFTPAATSVPQVQSVVSTEPGATPGIEPTAETAIATLTSIPVPAPTPTTAKLQLEIVQSQAWTDRDGNTRVNVLVHNPYDFPVAPAFRARANLKNSAGKFMRTQELYFLDGISGGNGFILPGETIAANACFTCEKTPLTEKWGSVDFESVIEDASGRWNFYTQVEATLSSVSFEGDSPIFWVSGTVKNNTKEKLNRISARVFVFDQKGNLIGAAEASAWDVSPGASASFKSYGIGKSPAGAVKSEVTALGVKY